MERLSINGQIVSSGPTERPFFQEVRRRNGEKERYVQLCSRHMNREREQALLLVYLLAWYRLPAGWLHSDGGQCGSRSWAQSSELCTRWLWPPLCEKQGRVRATGQWGSFRWRRHSCPPCLPMLSQLLHWLPHILQKGPVSRLFSLLPPSWANILLITVRPRSSSGVSHWAFPLGGPGLPSNALTQSWAPREGAFQRLPLGRTRRSKNLPDRGCAHTSPLFLTFPSLKSHKEGAPGVCKSGMATSVNIFALCCFLPITFSSLGSAGLSRAVRVHKHLTSTPFAEINNITLRFSRVQSLN